jgi:hypothetical protein
MMIYLSAVVFQRDLTAITIYLPLKTLKVGRDKTIMASTTLKDPEELVARIGSCRGSAHILF